MDISSTLAANQYAKARQVTDGGVSSGAVPDFVAMAQNFETTLRETEAVAQKAMLGEAGPQALVEALAQSQLAVETAVTLRDKVVEAYQEILRMPM